MNLKERERTILQLAERGLRDYMIARRINTSPQSVTRSRKNAQQYSEKQKQIMNRQRTRNKTLAVLKNLAKKVKK